jgi:hypothetical protein
MGFNNAPHKKSHRNRAAANGYERLPDKWPYGKKTKSQWTKAFEEEAKH